MAMLAIKAKPVVEPPNCAVHDEGEKPGGVITISSLRCLYCQVRGWLGVGGRVRECRAAGLCGTFGELAIHSQAFGRGCPFYAPFSSYVRVCVPPDRLSFVIMPCNSG